MIIDLYKINLGLNCELKLKKARSKKKVCIIGKGVSFDTGGLNLKTGSGMALMKKDMGGAANSIGLAKLISAHKLEIDVNLQEEQEEFIGNLVYLELKLN